MDDKESGSPSKNSKALDIKLAAQVVNSPVFRERMKRLLRSTTVTQSNKNKRNEGKVDIFSPSAADPNDSSDFKEAPKLKKHASKLQLKQAVNSEGTVKSQDMAKLSDNKVIGNENTDDCTPSATTVSDGTMPSSSSLRIEGYLKNDDAMSWCILCEVMISRSDFEEHRQVCLRNKFSKNSASGIDTREERKCEVCKRIITSMSVDAQTRHINNCLDKADRAKQEMEKFKEQMEKAKVAVLPCPLCHKDFKSDQSRKLHVKKCAKDKGVLVETLKLQMRQQEEEYKTKLDANILPDKFALPSNKSKTAPKTSKPAAPKSALDENTQLAFALSRSMMEDQHQDDFTENRLNVPALVSGGDSRAGGKGVAARPTTSKGKKGKQTEGSYLLLSTSKEQASMRIHNRMENCIFPSDNAQVLVKTPPFKIKSKLSKHVPCAASDDTTLQENSFLKEPSSQGIISQARELWSKSSLELPLETEKDPAKLEDNMTTIDQKSDRLKFYVKQLMPPVNVSGVTTGSKIKRLSMIPGRKRSAEFEARGNNGSSSNNDNDESEEAAMEADEEYDAEVDRPRADEKRVENDPVLASQASPSQTVQNLMLLAMESDASEATRLNQSGSSDIFESSFIYQCGSSENLDNAQQVQTSVGCAQGLNRDMPKHPPDGLQHPTSDTVLIPSSSRDHTQSNNESTQIPNEASGCMEYSRSSPALTVESHKHPKSKSKNNTSDNDTSEHTHHSTSNTTDHPPPSSSLNFAQSRNGLNGSSTEPLHLTQNHSKSSAYPSDKSLQGHTHPGSKREQNLPVSKPNLAKQLIEGEEHAFLAKFVNRPDFSDVSIMVSDSLARDATSRSSKTIKELHAHKIVLFAHSPELMNLCRKRHDGIGVDVIDLSELYDEETVLCMLRYFYNDGRGTWWIPDCHDQLLLIAERFSIQRLADLAERQKLVYERQLQTVEDDTKLEPLRQLCVSYDSNHVGEATDEDITNDIVKQEEQAIWPDIDKLECKDEVENTDEMDEVENTDEMDEVENTDEMDDQIIPENPESLELLSDLTVQLTEDIEEGIKRIKRDYKVMESTQTNADDKEADSRSLMVYVEEINVTVRNSEENLEGCNETARTSEENIEGCNETARTPDENIEGCNETAETVESNNEERIESRQTPEAVKESSNIISVLMKENANGRNEQIESITDGKSILSNLIDVGMDGRNESAEDSKTYNLTTPELQRTSCNTGPVNNGKHKRVTKLQFSKAIKGITSNLNKSKPSDIQKFVETIQLKTEDLAQAYLPSPLFDQDFTPDELSITGESKGKKRRNKSNIRKIKTDNSSRETPTKVLHFSNHPETPVFTPVSLKSNSIKSATENINADQNQSCMNILHSETSNTHTTSGSYSNFSSINKQPITTHSQVKRLNHQRTSTSTVSTPSCSHNTEHIDHDTAVKSSASAVEQMKMSTAQGYLGRMETVTTSCSEDYNSGEDMFSDDDGGSPPRPFMKPNSFTSASNGILSTKNASSPFSSVNAYRNSAMKLNSSTSYLSGVQNEQSPHSEASISQQKQKPTSISGQTESQLKRNATSISGQTESQLKQNPTSVLAQTETQQKRNPTSISGQTESQLKQNPTSISGQTESQLKQNPTSILAQTESQQKQNPTSISGQTESQLKQNPTSISGQTESQLKQNPMSISVQTESQLSRKNTSISAQTEYQLSRKPMLISKQTESPTTVQQHQSPFKTPLPSQLSTLKKSPIVNEGINKAMNNIEMLRKDSPQKSQKSTVILTDQQIQNGRNNYQAGSSNNSSSPQRPRRELKSAAKSQSLSQYDSRSPDDKWNESCIFLSQPVTPLSSEISPGKRGTRRGLAKKDSPLLKKVYGSEETLHPSSPPDPSHGEFVSGCGNPRDGDMTHSIDACSTSNRTEDDYTTSRQNFTSLKEIPCRKSLEFDYSSSSLVCQSNSSKTHSSLPNDHTIEKAVSSSMLQTGETRDDNEIVETNKQNCQTNQVNVQKINKGKELCTGDEIGNEDDDEVDGEAAHGENKSLLPADDIDVDGLLQVNDIDAEFFDGDDIAPDFFNDDDDDSFMLQDDSGNKFQQNVSVKTPVHWAVSSLRKQWKEPSPFTPMLPYDTMNTPQLKKAVEKIGVRALGKKRNIELLKTIYKETHQYETDSDYEPTPVKRFKPSTYQAQSIACERAITDTSSSVGVIPGRNGVCSGSSGQTVADVGNTGDECDDRDDEINNSQESNSSNGPDVMEESILQGWPDDEDEESAPIQLTQNSAEVLIDRLGQFIQDNVDIHEDILLYRPLELDVLKKRLTEANIKISMQNLMNFLDEKCITFTMKNMSKRNQKPQKKNKTAKKKNECANKK